MAVYQWGFDATFIADADLTTWQYRFVTVASTAGYVKAATGGSNPGPVGILQNSPSLGQEAQVRVFGFSKLVGRDDGTCNMAFGRFLAASNGGQGYHPAAGSQFIGRWYDAAITTANASAIGQAFFYGGLATCMASGS